MNGGLFSNQLTEIVGASGSGKTELCYCVLKKGLGDSRIRFLFLDSGQSFSYSRLAKVVDFGFKKGF